MILLKRLSEHWRKLRCKERVFWKQGDGKQGDVLLGSRGTFFLLHIYLSIVLLFWRGLEDLMTGLGGGVGFNCPGI